LDEAEIDYTRSHPDTDDKAIWYKHARMRGANRFVTTSDGHHKAYKVHDEHDDKHVGTWDIHHEMGWIHEEVIDELSKRTLANYIRGASQSAAGHGIDVGKYQGKVSKTGARPNGDADDSHTDARYQDDTKKMFKRLHGIGKASHQLAKEEVIDEAHKVIDNHQDEHGNRFEVHAHNQGHSSEWHAIMKTHQGGEKVHAVIATGKPAYIRGQMKTIKARKYAPMRTEETLDEGKRRESKMEPIKHKGKTIGHIWKNAHGEHEAEHTKTGMSWASDDKNDLISQVKDQHDSMREETLDEISPATAKSYIYKSVSSQHKLKVRARNAPIIADPDDPRAMEKAWDKHDRLMKKVALRRKGLRRATDTLLRAKAKGAHIDEETLDEATKYFTDAAEWHKHAQVHGHVVFKTGGPTKTQGPTLGAHSKTGEHRGTFVYDKKGHGGKGWQFTPYHEVKEETISENDTKCNAFGHRPFKGTCLDCGAPVSQSTRPGYSAVAVDKAIKSSRKKISGREAKLIHRLLRGRH
jgi:hypothetical protein